MRTLPLLLLLACGCANDGKANGWNTRQFEPHQPSVFRQTPGGHLREVIGGPVTQGYITDADIDAAVDAGFSRFAVLYYDLPMPAPHVGLMDDYTMWVGMWAGGVTINRGEIIVCLWSRGISPTDPGATYIKRAPDSNYAWWRFSAEPLCPAVCHELLHCVIDDPGHTSALWARMN